MLVSTIAPAPTLMKAAPPTCPPVSAPDIVKPCVTFEAVAFKTLNVGAALVESASGAVQSKP